MQRKEFVSEDVIHRIHRYLRQNINFFGQRGGFKAWTRQLRALHDNSSTTLSPTELYVHLEPFRQMITYLDPRFLLTLVAHFKYLTRDCLCNMLRNEEVMKTTTLAEFSHLVTQIEEILFEVLDNESARVGEELQAHCALAFIECPKVNFEQNLSALKHLVDMILHVEYRYIQQKSQPRGKLGGHQQSRVVYAFEFLSAGLGFRGG